MKCSPTSRICVTAQQFGKVDIHKKAQNSLTRPFDGLFFAVKAMKIQPKKNIRPWEGTTLFTHQRAFQQLHINTPSHAWLLLWLLGSNFAASPGKLNCFTWEQGPLSFFTSLLPTEFHADIWNQLRSSIDDKGIPIISFLGKKTRLEIGLFQNPPCCSLQVGVLNS